MPDPSRYEVLLVKIFKNHYRKGADKFVKAGVKLDH